jgi:hypothetical protein
MAILLLVLLGVVACASASPHEGAVEVELDDFYIEPASSLVKAGTIDLQLWDEGAYPHTLVVATETGTVLAASDVLAPEGRQTLTVRLEPGTYQLTCRIVFRGEDGLLIDHYQEGMGTEIDVEP